MYGAFHARKLNTLSPTARVHFRKKQLLAKGRCSSSRNIDCVKTSKHGILVTYTQLWFNHLGTEWILGPESVAGGNGKEAIFHRKFGTHSSYGSPWCEAGWWRYLALVVNVIVDYLLVPVLDPLELCFLRQLPVALCLRITPCRGLNVPSCRDHFQLSCCVRLTCKWSSFIAKPIDERHLFSSSLEPLNLKTHPETASKTPHLAIDIAAHDNRVLDFRALAENEGCCLIELDDASTKLFFHCYQGVPYVS